MARFPSSLLLVVGIGCLCSVNFTRPAAAIAPEAKSPARIALIDMAKVYKRFTFFEAQREALKLKIADSEVVAEKMLAKMQQETKRLERLEPGSDERRQLEAELKRLQSEFEAFRKEKVGELLKQESQIYMDVYLIVSNAVGAYTAYHEIDLVVRFNTTDIDRNMEPKQQFESMNEHIIYENHLDITKEIIAIINEK